MTTKKFDVQTNIDALVKSNKYYIKYREDDEFADGDVDNERTLVRSMTNMYDGKEVITDGYDSSKKIVDDIITPICIQLIKNNDFTLTIYIFDCDFKYSLIFFS